MRVTYTITRRFLNGNLQPEATKEDFPEES